MTENDNDTSTVEDRGEPADNTLYSARVDANAISKECGFSHVHYLAAHPFGLDENDNITGVDLWTEKWFYVDNKSIIGFFVGNAGTGAQEFR